MKKANKKMTNILDQIDKEESNVIEIFPTALQELIFPKTKIIHECIIIDNKNEISPHQVNYNRIIEMYGDKTGYEASCNEVRINDYIQEGEMLDVIRLAQIIIQGWKYKLKMEYPEYTFCIELVCCNEYSTMRFYVHRDNEKGWLKEDLESYVEEAILKEIF